MWVEKPLDLDKATHYHLLAKHWVALGAHPLLSEVNQDSIP
jgi:hypothetical protein